MGILQVSLEPEAGVEGAAAHIGCGCHAFTSGCARRFALFLVKLSLVPTAPLQPPVSTVRKRKSRLSYSRIDDLVRDPGGEHYPRERYLSPVE